MCTVSPILINKKLLLILNSFELKIKIIIIKYSFFFIIFIDWQLNIWEKMKYFIGIKMKYKIYFKSEWNFSILFIYINVNKYKRNLIKM